MTLNKDDFCIIVERLVLQDKITYAEAILHICEDHTIDIQTVRNFINTPLKQKILTEANERNQMRDKDVSSKGASIKALFS